MMFNYPFFGYKSRNYPYRYYNYPGYQNQYNNSNLFNKELKSNTISEEKNAEKEEPLDDRTTNNNTQFFSILGIKLYFDDLIILALLYFLYSEGVKDEGLFISLILLLLS